MAIETERKLIITGPDMDQPLEIPMEQVGVATIGRDIDNSLQVKHPLVSRKHAEIRATVAACVLTDLDSTYGTLVNGQRIAANEPVELKNGDTITFGPYEIAYEAEEFEVPELAELEAEADVPEPEKRNGAVAHNGRYPRPPIDPPEPPTESVNGTADGIVLPGLSKTYSRYLQYLPEIYHTRFMGKFLALFESIWAPLEWQVENFDLYLNPRTAPAGFLPWLANWFDVVFDDSWEEEQRRQLLLEAHDIYARRGTKSSLERVLGIYVGQRVEIDDQSEELEPFTFLVRIPKKEFEMNRVLVERLIDVNKPAHTSYTLLFVG